jgi:type IX secretion system PorP/SprF family membrane protein
MRFIIFIFSFFLLVSAAKAQDPHFSQFFASPLTLNPAYTGKISGMWRLAANHRDQWPSIPKAYVTTTASFDFPAFRKVLSQRGDVLGIGLMALTDASGNSALELNYGSLAVSYHKALDAEGYNTLGAGFQGSYNSLNLDLSKLQFEDQLGPNGFTNPTGEALGPGQNLNRSYFDINAGLLFSGSSNGENNYYAGVSMYHINRPRVSLQDQNWYLTGRVTLHAGGTFMIGENLSLSTSALHQAQNKATETLFGGALGVMAASANENPATIYLGSWYRVSDALIPYIGLEIAGLRLGASYDVNASSLKAATNSRGGMEVSLIYVKPPPDPTGIPCPKF